MKLLKAIFLDDFMFTYFGLTMIMNIGFIISLVAKLQGRLR